MHARGRSVAVAVVVAALAGCASRSWVAFAPSADVPLDTSAAAPAPAVAEPPAKALLPRPVFRLATLLPELTWPLAAKPSLDEAERHDLAERLVAAHPGDRALAWLDGHGADIHLRDLVVAVLAEHGRYDDAIEVDTSIARTGAQRSMCERELRLARMLPLERIANTALVNTAFRGAECIQRMTELEQALAGQHDEQPLTRFVRAYRSWPGAAMSPSGWLITARIAESALALRGAEVLAITALDNAVRTSCDRATVFEVNVAASRLRTSAHHDDRLDDRVAELASLSPSTCEAR